MSRRYFSWNCINEWTKSRIEVVVTSYGRNNNRDNEIKKNIAGQILTYNSKNFHWLKRKLELKWTMNGLEKPFRKKSVPKNWKKNCKNQSEIAACEQQKTSEKANFCSNTVFSLYFKFKVKKFHVAKPLAFSLHFLFRRDQNHYSNLTSKKNENVWTDLKKKDSAPIRFKFFEL